MYRLYIDESGDHRYHRSQIMAQRYLSLTGIILKQEVYQKEVIPKIEKIRSYFYEDYDDKPPLHLSDIMAGKDNFIAIKDETIKQSFNQDFLSLVGDVDYQIITVVIDKNKHQDKYLKPFHPYHWGLRCIMERYCSFLLSKNSSGDVMAESRGKKEDRELQEAFSKFYDSSSDFASSINIQLRLANNKIKFRQKIHLICGLEMADLLALSSKIDVLKAYNHIDHLSDNFTAQVISVIQDKYYKGNTGVKGNGKKLLP
ncbi:MAG: DUF3800 domain-containing protein [Candidatus Saccharibacteria bacterium]|nr:DUF3800 domain-containing protein [Candidatus Saccharibacteria bacterium]